MTREPFRDNSQDAVEITKSYTIATPQKDIGGHLYNRNWTLAEVENAMWQARAAGATDDTEVSMGYEGIHIQDIPAYVTEIPPAMRIKSTREEQVLTKEPWINSPWFTRSLFVIGVGILLPFVIPLLIYVLKALWSIV